MTRDKAPEAAVREFAALKYGMFIHYGLYSLWGRNEWIMGKERISPDEYRKAVEGFRPATGCVKEWIQLAARNHMRYACLTTRHHDGFALWDSKADDFNAVKAPCNRDLVREFVDACHDENIAPCLYYSVGNWSDQGFREGPTDNPDAWRHFVETCHAQLRELMINYGRIHYLFYDGCPPPETWDAAGANAMIRNQQPDILISSRCSLDEDVPSSEQSEFPPSGVEGFWESCFTIPRFTWGWNRFDEDIKSPSELCRLLMSSVHRGGNFLLNIGPDISGRVHEAEENGIQAVGRWLDRNGEAIFGIQGKPFNYSDLEISTGREGAAYIGFFGNDYGPEKVIGGIGNKVKAVHVIGKEQNITFRQKGDRLFLDGLSYKPTGSMPRVIKLELDGYPHGIVNPFCNSSRFRTD